MKVIEEIADMTNFWQKEANKLHPDYTDHLIFLAILTIVVGILFALIWWPSSQKSQQAEPVLKQAVEGSQSLTGTFPNPCTLHDVVCPGEPKTIYATITNYEKSTTCPSRACITAAGTVAIPHLSAACPRSMPLGRRISVAGTVYTCDDRTSARYDGRFDLFEGNDSGAYTRAKAFGKQWLEVAIY